ncbi:MAG TPA: MBL fold metallo-hydrolase [Roseiarcus sp.]|jgi:7,8-dihydropterin-6-yl-methyl-4-(beta-D-ribofuranosyl)aminobenzene 5'-phosphate synthase|nr:MBL fold metallo-hydrolase [Roseiarcus sp.]
MRRVDHARIGRRGVVYGGGAAAIGAVLDSYFGALKPARAQEATRAPPEIDRLAVRVLVDSYQIAVAPSFKRENVDVERFGWALGEAPPSKALISEFGLSLHAESRRGDETRNVLIDFGFTPNALNNNLDLLGVDPASFDALILSHGHYDHFGGMAGFLRAAQGKLRQGTPFVVGGEECFCARRWTAAPLAGNFGALDRSALKEAKLTIVSAEAPSSFADHALTTGQVPLATFEKVLSPSKMTIGVSGGLGCYPEKLPEDERQGGTIPDQFRHEIATVYNLKGRGLIVLTSCSHRGVVNIIKRAQAVSGVAKVHAVMGGFHLAPFKEDYVRQTIAGLKEIDPDCVVPMHCTGEPFWDLARAEMPNKVLRAYTGTRFVFNA